MKKVCVLNKFSTKIATKSHGLPVYAVCDVADKEVQNWFKKL